MLASGRILSSKWETFIGGYRAKACMPAVSTFFIGRRGFAVRPLSVLGYNRYIRVQHQILRVDVALKRPMHFQGTAKPQNDDSGSVKR